MDKKARSKAKRFADKYDMSVNEVEKGIEQQKIEMSNSKYEERPKLLEGTTERVETGCGHLYITVNKDEAKRVIEVFASLGKTGGCSKCYAEALTKSISIGLRSGVKLERYHKILDGIVCIAPSYDEGVHIKSCPDAIAKVIKKHIIEES
jgi:ribonucleoside-diphosphate reductase alpha chain